MDDWRVVLSPNAGGFERLRRRRDRVARQPGWRPLAWAAAVLIGLGLMALMPGPQSQPSLSDRLQLSMRPDPDVGLQVKVPGGAALEVDSPGSNLRILEIVKLNEQQDQSADY